MSGDHSTKPPSSGSSLLLLLQVMHDRIAAMDRRIQTIETIHMRGSWQNQPEPTDTLPSIWSRLKEAVTVAGILHKVWQALRSVVPWIGMGWEGFRMLFRLLGLH